MNTEFNYGMKVSLGGEFGVVVKSESDAPNFLGMIRWDTQKENDLEDWRGLFGTFVNMGGKVIEESHEFNFINNDGSTKACL